MKKFKEKRLHEIQFEDLDMGYPFFEEGEKEEEKNWIEFDHEVASDTSPVDIDIFIEELERMRKYGATHVYMVADVDHHGYIITGVQYKEI